MAFCRALLHARHVHSSGVDQRIPNLDGTISSVILPLAVVAASAILIYRADNMRALAVLSLISVIWTYHYRYDFVVLLCAIAFLSAPLLNHAAGICGSGRVFWQ